MNNYNFPYPVMPSETELVKARKKVADFVSNAKANNRKISFLTLVFPSALKHTQKELEKYCLKPFLVFLTESFNVSYVWRCLLNAKGNFYFRLVVDSVVPLEKLREKWNQIINKGAVKGIADFNYVDSYQREKLEFYKDGFKLKPEHTNDLEYLNIPYLKKYLSEMAKPEVQRFANPATVDIMIGNEVSKLSQSNFIEVTK